MDLARVLVRSVVRAFYETEHVVIIDALVNHSALVLQDLALVVDLGKQQKLAAKLCGRLKEGGLISVFTRQEMRDGSNKPTNRDYYYIDYQRAIDATKYRIHMLDEKIKAASKPTTEKKELACSQCGSQWTYTEVLDSIDPMQMGSGFLCKRCRGPLKSLQKDSNTGPETDDTPAMFNKQFAKILKLLQQIDEAIIPAIDGETALACATPLPRDEFINPLVKHQPVQAPTARPTAVKGITTGPEKIEISISTDSENTAAQQAAEAERKAKITAQNQLPEWHTHSTVTGELTTVGERQNAARLENDISVPLMRTDNDDVEEKKTRDPALDEYFAALKAEQERQEQEDEEEDEDDEDDDEFEDVVAGDVDGVPDSKRIKIEDFADSQPMSISTPLAGEESDEDEFEDVA